MEKTVRDQLFTRVCLRVSVTNRRCSAGWHPRDAAARHRRREVLHVRGGHGAHRERDLRPDLQLLSPLLRAMRKQCRRQNVAEIFRPLATMSASPPAESEPAPAPADVPDTTEIEEGAAAAEQPSAEAEAVAAETPAQLSPPAEPEPEHVAENARSEPATEPAGAEAAASQAHSAAIAEETESEVAQASQAVSAHDAPTRPRTSGADTDTIELRELQDIPEDRIRTGETASSYDDGLPPPSAVESRLSFDDAPLGALARPLTINSEQSTRYPDFTHFSPSRKHGLVPPKSPLARRRSLWSAMTARRTWCGRSASMPRRRRACTTSARLTTRRARCGAKCTCRILTRDSSFSTSPGTRASSTTGSSAHSTCCRATTTPSPARASGASRGAVLRP